MAVDRERLAERLAAVERRLTDADPDEGLADVAAVEGRLAELEERADAVEARVGELESGFQALRGYVGGIDAVDESVERRADAALAKAEALEAGLVDDPDLTVERVPTDGGGDAPANGSTPRTDDPGSSVADAPGFAAVDGPGPPGTDGSHGSDEPAGSRLVERIRDAL